MNKLLPNINLKTLKTYADWELLLFLVLFLNVKLGVKVVALAFIYLLRFNFKFGFFGKDSRLPLFYIAALALPFVGLAANVGRLNINYLLVFCTGLAFWGLCILAAHQIKLAVERNTPDVLHHTLFIFLLLNVVISLANIGFIIIQTGEINPYTYQGEYQKYFIGTGDYIKGISFDTSTTNAILNSFGVIYFLVRKNAIMVLACMATLLLTGSNFTNLVLVLIMTLLFIFNSDRLQKSLMVVCLVFLVIFMAKISPQNDKYVNETFNTVLGRPQPKKTDEKKTSITEIPDSLLNADERREKIAQLHIDSLNRVLSGQLPAPKIKPADPELVTDNGRLLLPKANIHSAPYQSLKTTPEAQKPLVTFINTHKEDLPISGQQLYATNKPGKLIGFMQTFGFLRQHPLKFLTGDGIGNFSSKLAFRVTGLGMSGGYPAKYTYINPDFEKNHLDLYLNYFSKRSGYHSITNTPFSVYDQLLAEYGLPGLLALAIFYLGFFARHYKTLTYGLPILLLTTAILFADYWFEQLSVLIVFELFLHINTKETQVAHAKA